MCRDEGHSRGSLPSCCCHITGDDGPCSDLAQRDDAFLSLSRSTVMCVPVASDRARCAARSTSSNRFGTWRQHLQPPEKRLLCERIDHRVRKTIVTHNRHAARQYWSGRRLRLVYVCVPLHRVNQSLTQSAVDGWWERHVTRRHPG